MLPDRIETGTYAMAAAIAGGEVELTGTRGRSDRRASSRCCEAIGTEITETNRGIAVHRNGVRPIVGGRDDRRRFRAFPPICRRNSWR